MNEDEAFIRAIVDNPGDDTPRLVYADWLDDRDDPRGRYLRAEREVVETGDIARLRELAAELDPVWVARVSMPPVGMCIEHVELERRGPTVSRADIAAVESTISASFPPDYVAFLLNYNGGEVPAFPRVQTAEGEITRVFESGWVFASCGQIKRYRLRPMVLIYSVRQWPDVCRRSLNPLKTGSHATSSSVAVRMLLTGSSSALTARIAGSFTSSTPASRSKLAFDVR